VIPPVVTTERLTLPVWTPEEAADIRAGRRRPGWHPDYPRRDDRDAATLYRPGDPWAPRHIVRGTTTLGSIGFFGPPEAAADGVPEVEVGYGLVEEARGWGFATEALRAVLAETDTVTAVRQAPGGTAAIGELTQAVRRVPMARRFHNDAVRAARAVREHRVVRWFRLAGHAPFPLAFEMDDEPPTALAERAA